MLEHQVYVLLERMFYPCKIFKTLGVSVNYFNFTKTETTSS